MNIKKWFKDLFNKWSGIKKDYSDDYQIRKITLVDGTNKFYPEYRNSSLGEWNQLYKLHSGVIERATLSPIQLVTDIAYHLTTEEQAVFIITDYKEQLNTERAKDFESLEIIKID